VLLDRVDCGRLKNSRTNKNTEIIGHIFEKTLAYRGYAAWWCDIGTCQICVSVDIQSEDWVMFPSGSITAL
jgi:hypothetical protein